MSTRSLTLLLLLPAVAFAGRRDKTDGPAVVPAGVGPTVVPASGLYLRNASDTDPSRYLGRFVANGVVVPDETSAAKKTCSTFVKYTGTPIGTGNVAHDEYFSATRDAAANVGVPPFAALSASGGDTTVVRVKYVLTHKMVGDIEDPAGFEACCKKAPDQCSERYIGEFLEGTGSVWYGTSSDLSVGGKASVPVPSVPTVVGVDVEVKDGMQWKRSITFDTPVYFAFKTAGTGWESAPYAPGCSAWIDNPPKSTQATYFVGVADPIDSETKARQLAMQDAREQVVKWLGTEIATGSVRTDKTIGREGTLSTRLSDEGFVTTAASGIATQVKDATWCVKTIGTPAGNLQKVWVLASLPTEAEAAAADAVVEVLGTESGER